MTFKTLVPAVVLTATALSAAPQDIRLSTTVDIQKLEGALAGAVPGSQPMKTGTGVIFGQVTEADSNRPVPGAIVSVNLPGTQPLRVMADSQGRFGFRDMPA